MIPPETPEVNIAPSDHRDAMVPRRVDAPHAAADSAAVARSADAALQVASEGCESLARQLGVGQRHAAVQRQAQAAGGSARRSVRDENSGCSADDETPDAGPQWHTLCGAHAEDLIESIQRCSDDLDARSARLYADIAIHERRERAFRLWAQRRSEELRQLRAQLETERQQLRAQARQIAVQSTVDRWVRSG